MKHISVDHAAHIIGVSSATIRNWVKAGHISPISTHPLAFLEESILLIQDQIKTKKIGKLKARANKVYALNIFCPDEYANNSALPSHIAKIVEYVRQEQLEIEPVMFLAALYLLVDNGEVVLPESRDRVFELKGCKWHRQSVKKVIYGWRASLSFGKPTKKYRRLSELFGAYEEDYLGLLYQCLSTAGSKSNQGLYFTPTQLVKDSLSSIKKPIQNFLDPCCGTGKFLVHAAQMFALKPENVIGFDVDGIATNIARLNLLLTYKEQEFTPNIHRMDALSELATGEVFCETNKLLDCIDAIATNPPWGAYTNAIAKSQSSDPISSGETFSLFVEKSIRLLQEGGQLSFILPESILNIRIHSDVRALILNNATITAISLLGRPFASVYSPVIRLDLVKERPDEQSLTRVEHNGNVHFVSQSRFKANEHLTFNIQIKSHEESLLKRIYSIDHCTLARHAAWALGIVTGNNKQYVLDAPTPESEPVFRGSDIYPFALGKPGSYICFEPDKYQQVASEKYYRAPEKLLYKFISNDLVFAYDDKQSLSLNSANILIPSIPGMSIKVVLAFLNSKVFKYLFVKNFSTHKILRGDLEKLPFPVINGITHDAMESLVDVAIADQKAPEELEKIIFASFDLNAKDIALITEMIQK